MRGDFEFQMQYVRSSVHRILDAQDLNPLSPSFGCLHTAYWRDKTSEFPDSRFQEGAAVLGLLLHDRLRSPDSPPREALMWGFSVGVQGWFRQQHPDGSFDEWYKGEHGFAATSFGVVAFGLCLYFLRDVIDSGTRSLVQRALIGAARWLCRHDDFVKTNHEAAGAAALALAGVLLNDQDFVRGARAKHARVLECQTEEGWFPEIGGIDIGYTFLLIDYMMIYRLVMEDDSGVDALAKAYACAASFVRPDLTVSAEAGLCANPYVSRLGTLLLADRSPEAAWLLHEFVSRSAGARGLASYLSDDLRFFRWGCLPLVSWLLFSEIQEAGVLPPRQERGATVGAWTTFPRAGLMIRRSQTWTVEFIPASGGLVRVYPSSYGERFFIWENQGVCLRTRGALFATVGYDPHRPSYGQADDEAWTQLSLSECRYVFPGLLARLALRLGCAVPWMSPRVRAWIDRYRLLHRTAGNQSVGVMTAGESGVSILRFVEVSEEKVSITDRIRVEDGQVFVSDLAWINGPRLTSLADIPFSKETDLPLSLKTGDIHEFRQELHLSPTDADSLEVVYHQSPGLPEG